MSEYQYYEFLALDRPLTTSERTYVESLSSRVQLTSTQAIFVYNYSDFRGDPKELLEKCFDVMLYIANWGSRQIMFRLPKSLVDVAALEAYCLEDTISVSTTRNFVIIDIHIIDEELCSWIDDGEGEEWLSRLIPLRSELLGGDFRALYLAWLKVASMLIEEEEDESESYEPPVPPNLGDLSASLNTLVEFLDIDKDLIAVATTASLSQPEEPESLEDLIPLLSEKERNSFLMRVLEGETHLAMALANRLREFSVKRKVSVNSDTPRRTLSELLKLAQEQIVCRQRKEQEVARKVRVQKLEALATKEEKVWEEVYKLIELKQSKPYDQAVAHLVELRDLAQHQGKSEEFQSSINYIKKNYSNRPGLISRLQRVGLLS